MFHYSRCIFIVYLKYSIYTQNIIYRYIIPIVSRFETLEIVSAEFNPRTLDTR